MVKKISVDSLETGMYVCGFSRSTDAKVITFVSNMLVRDEYDIERFQSCGYSAAYVVVPSINFYPAHSY